MLRRRKSVYTGDYLTRRNKTVRAYKCLKPGGRSQYQDWSWPLPDDDEGEPGDWVELNAGVQVVICSSGFHGYLSMDYAKEQGPVFDIYEMEIEGDIVTDRIKAAGRRARLVRKLWDYKHGEVVRMADLVWQ